MGSQCRLAGEADDDGFVEVEDELSVWGEMRLGESVRLADADSEVAAETGGADVAGRFVVERADRKCLGHYEARRLDGDLSRVSVEEQPDGLGTAESLEEVGVQMYASARPLQWSRAF